MPSARIKTVHRCAECGATAAKWSGQCVACGAWNTMHEERDHSGAGAGSARSVSRGGLGYGGLAPRASAVPIGKVDGAQIRPVPTGIAEVDLVLGGGFVPGSVTLLGGEPGIGKSTVLLQLLARHGAAGRVGLLVSGEESSQQVRLRAERLGAVNDNIWLASETNLPDVIGHIEQVGPSLVVIDSIQTLVDPAFDSAPGSVTQVRECANELVKHAKRTGVSVVLVGHVTKEGGLAGPRALEHVVDTVLAFEGDRFHSLRMLRAVKHRFGATGELGLFEMTEEGLSGVADPSQLFLADRQIGAAGSVITVALEGHRPLLLEVQALVAPTQLANPRRATQGVDQNRLQMIVAVLTRRLKAKLHEADVFASVVGGVRLTEPASDLAVALAMCSSSNGRPIPEEVVAFGEIGLAGEVRQVSHAAKRLQEAKRLGFRRAIVPMSAPDAGEGIEVVRVRTLDEAVRLLGIWPESISRVSARPGRARAARIQARYGRPSSREPQPWDDPDEWEDAGDLDDAGRW